MADSIRQQIIDAIETQLGTILTTNGYETNLGSNIFVWKPEPFAATEVPGADIQDQEETTDLAAQLHEHLLTIAVKVVGSGATIENDTRKYIADVIKAVGVDVTWGALAQDTAPTGIDLIDVAIDDAVRMGVQLNFIIQYTTVPFDPYTNP